MTVTRSAKSPLSRPGLAWLAGVMLPWALAGCSSDAEASDPPTEDAAGVSPTTANPVAKDGPAYDPRESLAPLVQAVGPAVVSIRARGRQNVRGFFGSTSRVTQGSGSGFVISADGRVVTNHHVIDNAEQLEVALHDGRTFDARLVGSDPETDLAVLQLEGASDLQTIQFADSDEVAVGDWVVAIGNPMGLDHSASVGIISGRGRGSLGLYADSYIDFLQTDADIAPGSSGGPLFDLNGRVVGITTAVGASSGPGFAIPSSQAQQVLRQLQDTGHVVRGWLGAGNEAEGGRHRGASAGATLGRVFADTPAAEAGLRRGDIVTKVDATTISDFDDLRRTIALTEPGHTILLEVIRGDEHVELTAVIRARPSSEVLSSLQTQRTTRDRRPLPSASPPSAPRGIGDRLGVQVKANDNGLEIVRADTPGVATDLDLQAGDIITAINGEQVRSSSDVRAAMARSHDRIEVEMIREGVKHKVSLERS